MTNNDHCTACGSIEADDINTDDGYSACCNEPVGDCSDGRCTHEEDYGVTF